MTAAHLPKGQHFAYDNFCVFFKPKRIQLANKSALYLSLCRSVHSLQALADARLLVTLEDGPCAAQTPAPEAALGPAGLFTLCSGGDTVPGVKSWQWGTQKPSHPHQGQSFRAHVGLFCAVGEASHYGFR